MIQVFAVWWVIARAEPEEPPKILLTDVEQSSIGSINSMNRYAAYATDGDLSTTSSTEYGEPAWFEVKFSKKYFVNFVRVYNGAPNRNKGKLFGADVHVVLENPAQTGFLIMFLNY